MNFNTFWKVLFLGCVVVLSGCKSRQIMAQGEPRYHSTELESRAEHGDPKAQLEWGELLQKSAVNASESSKAIQWIRSAALQGLPQAEYQMGVCYSDGDGVPQDFAESLRWFRLGAKDGDSESEFRISLAYDKGYGVGRDLKEALKWEQVAAKHGNVHAEYNLGISYLGGLGTPQNSVEAFKWYQSAADGGFPPAMTALGEVYLSGLGVERDRTNAFKWFEKAAIAGEMRAQMYMAVRSYNLNDDAAAFGWLKKAADQWYLQAQIFISFHYEYGRGVKKDVVEAYKWVYLASEFGNKSGGEFLKALEGREGMTGGQIDEAKRRAQEFVKTNAFSLPRQQPADFINMERLFRYLNSKSSDGTNGKAPLFGNK